MTVVNLRTRQITNIAVCIALLAVGFVVPADAALIDDLELYYRFDNDTLTAGGINDLSGIGRNGSPVDEDGGGIVMGFSGDVPAQIGFGMSLDLTGTTDFLRSDTPSYTGIAGGVNRTIALWIKSNATTNQTMVEWGINNAGERWTFRLNNSASNGTVGGIRTEVQSTYVISDTAVNDNNWHHVAVVFDVAGTPDKADINLYIDGVLETTTTTNGSNPTINSVLNPEVGIGGSNTFANRSVEGLMDDVAIWSRALSANEIAALANGAPIVIPEPSSAVLAMLAASFALLAGGRRNRRRPVN